MLELARVVPISAEQDRILSLAFVRCEELIAGRFSARGPTIAELAAKYAVSLRTVRYWRKAGCPFAGGQWRVLAWIAARRYAPAGTKAKFGRQLERHKWRAALRGFQGSLGDARQLKLAYKLNGIAPDDWLKSFRCPKGQFSAGVQAK
jgi:hypothetical protein